MFRRALFGLLAVAAISMLSPSVASARAGFGGFHGGFHHGGFHHGGFHGGGFHHGFGGLGLGLGLGLAAAAPFAFGYGYPYGAYPYSYAYYGGGCYLVPRRVWTPWGWHLRRIEVCD